MWVFHSKSCCKYFQYCLLVWVILPTWNLCNILLLKDFLKHLKDEFMPSTWEVDVCIKFNTMTQAENQTFCNFANAIQNKNSFLLGTTSHLNIPHLHTHIEAGMDNTLNKQAHVTNRNIQNIVGFPQWIDTLKELDAQLQDEYAELMLNLKQSLRNFMPNLVLSPILHIDITPDQLCLHPPINCIQIILQNSHMKRLNSLSTIKAVLNAASLLYSTWSTITVDMPRMQQRSM